MHESRRSLIDQWEAHPTAGLFGIDVIEAVFGKARVVGADVGGVVEIDPPGIVGGLTDSRCVVRRSRGGQLVLPFGELGKHGIHRGMTVFEG